jgi:hypothetical protein
MTIIIAYRQLAQFEFWLFSVGAENKKNNGFSLQFSVTNSMKTHKAYTTQNCCWLQVQQTSFPDSVL